MNKAGVVVGVLLGCLFLVMPVKGYAQDRTPENQELLQKIEELEDKVRRLDEEARARKRLEVTEEELEEREREILEAAGEEYTIDPRRTLGLTYGVSYSYSPRELITQQLDIRREAEHSLTHTLSTSYSILDNLSVSTGLPFVYRYNRLGTDEKISQNDIGDISLSLGFQPYRAKPGQLRTTIGFGASLPTGRSPYKINPETELSTGSGTYQFSVTGSFSKQIDPVVAFASVGYSHRLPLTGLEFTVAENVILEEVKFGDSVGAGVGLGYALSYEVSVNASFNYSYSWSTRLAYRNAPEDFKTPDSTSGSLSFGVGWRVSPKTTMSFGLGYSLTGTGFTLSVRAPFSFVL